MAIAPTLVAYIGMLVMIDVAECEAVGAYVLLIGSVLLSAVLLSCWAILALGKRWSPEPTWIDRMGRFLGASWIGLGALSFVVLLYRLFS